MRLRFESIGEALSLAVVASIAPMSIALVLALTYV
jgi:hypothetical protein